jgi:tetratricopeptide (TPR) repeat protein
LAPAAPAPAAAAPAPAAAIESAAPPLAAPAPMEAVDDEPRQKVRRAAPVVEQAPAAAPEPPQEWTRAMSEGLAALDAGRFAEAHAAFARAEAARPGASVVADGRRRAEEGMKAEALSGHRDRARAAEGAEDWKAALAEYDAALKVDARVAFAVDGRARTAPRAALDDALSLYLKRPERLSADNVLREAEGVLARAREVVPAGPRLNEQTTALQRAIEDARTPVGVRLLSDGRTDVAVLRVGALGTFHERSLSLRPGSYVVVGKRHGYRDTRKTLVVAPGRAPAPLDVRCDQTL